MVEKPKLILDFCKDKCNKGMNEIERDNLFVKLMNSCLHMKKMKRFLLPLKKMKKKKEASCCPTCDSLTNL